MLERLFRGQYIVLDGGVGTELTRRGYQPVGPLHHAAAARDVPELLAAIHRAYIDAGADVITAFTSRTTVRTLARAGYGMRAAAITHQAVDLALEACQQSSRPVAVAGALGTLEDPRYPGQGLCARTLADEHREQAMRLGSSGCHLVLVEAMPTLQETIAATAAARAAMPMVWTVLSLCGRDRVADETELHRAASCTVAAGAQALLLEGHANTDLVSAVSTLAGLALGVPLGVRVRADGDDTPEAQERFVTVLLQAAQRGARILGGGDGATPEHVRALAGRVRARAAA